MATLYEKFYNTVVLTRPPEKPCLIYCSSSEHSYLSEIWVKKICKRAPKQLLSHLNLFILCGWPWTRGERAVEHSHTRSTRSSSIYIQLHRHEWKLARLVWEALYRALATILERLACPNDPFEAYFFTQDVKKVFTNIHTTWKYVKKNLYHKQSLTELMVNIRAQLSNPP